LKPDNTTTSYPAGMRVGPLCCGGQQSGAVVDDNGAAKFHAASYPRRAHPQRCCSCQVTGILQGTCGKVWLVLAPRPSQ